MTDRQTRYVIRAAFIVLAFWAVIAGLIIYWELK